MKRCNPIAVLGILLAALASPAVADEPSAGAMVTLEVAVAEFNTGAENSGGLAELLNLFDNPLAQIAELESQGKTEAVTRFHLSVLEKHPSRIQLTEQAPLVTGRSRVGRSFGAGGGGDAGFVNSYSMQSIGSMLQVTPRVEADGAVVLEFMLEKSRLQPAPPSATDSGEFVPLGIRSHSVQTTVRIAPAQTLVFRASDSSKGGTLVLIAAKASVHSPASK